MPETGMVTAVTAEGKRGSSHSVILPLTGPELAGANVIFRSLLSPEARTSPAGTPLALKPGPEMLTSLTDISEALALVTVTERMLLSPVATSPKLTEEGSVIKPELEPPPVAPTHPDATATAKIVAGRKAERLRTDVARFPVTSFLRRSMTRQV